MYPYLASNIDYLFEKNKTNPNKLSREINVGQATLFRIQSRITEQPKRDVLDKIANWAGVTVFQLTDTDLSQSVTDDQAMKNEVQSVPDFAVRYAPVKFVEAKNPNNKNHVRIPIYRDVKASCGDGIENFLEDVSDYLEIDPELLKLMGVRSNSKNLKIIYSAEYSMYPTVAPDSPLFVDVSDKDPNNLKNGNVYVFTHNHELRMKRIFVSYGSNTVKLTSDNPDKNRYPDEFITNEQLNEINFIGRLELALIRP